MSQEAMISDACTLDHSFTPLGNDCVLIFFHQIRDVCVSGETEKNHVTLLYLRFTWELKMLPAHGRLYAQKAFTKVQHKSIIDSSICETYSHFKPFL